MGWFRRTPAPAVEPDVDRTSSLALIAAAALSTRVDSIQQTLDGFAAAIAVWSVRIEQVQTDLKNSQDAAKQYALTAQELAEGYAKNYADASYNLLKDRADTHYQTLDTLLTQVEEIRQKHGEFANQIRQNEIAIQQVARQRNGVGGIAGIA
jgi:hypothetical protein